MLWYNSNSQCAGGRTGTELDRQAGMPRLASLPPKLRSVKEIEVCTKLTLKLSYNYNLETKLAERKGILLEAKLAEREGPPEKKKWGVARMPSGICRFRQQRRIKRPGE